MKLYGNRSHYKSQSLSVTVRKGRPLSTAAIPYCLSLHNPFSAATRDRDLALDRIDASCLNSAAADVLNNLLCDVHHFVLSHNL